MGFTNAAATVTLLPGGTVGLSAGTAVGLSQGAQLTTSGGVVQQATVDMVTPAYFGGGTDGSATIASSTTLTRPMHYQNLTINSGVTLNTGNFPVFVAGTLTFVDATATIGVPGTPGVVPPVNTGTGTGGIATPSGYYQGGGNGGNGGASINGGGTSGAGVALPTPLAGGYSLPGGLGAPGVARTGAAGSAGAFTGAMPSGAPVIDHNLVGAVAGGGTGGGGTGGSNNDSAGGGGSGAGCCFLAATAITGPGTINCSGGTGALSYAGGSQSGSGGGGVAVVITGSAAGGFGATNLNVAGGAGTSPGKPGSAYYALVKVSA
jgi:hypothetical protein